MIDDGGGIIVVYFDFFFFQEEAAIRVGVRFGGLGVVLRSQFLFLNFGNGRGRRY